TRIRTLPRSWLLTHYLFQAAAEAAAEAAVVLPAAAPQNLVQNPAPLKHPQGRLRMADADSEASRSVYSRVADRRMVIADVGPILRQENEPEYPANPDNSCRQSSQRRFQTVSQRSRC